ncbi:hypothetical protein [Saccharothrix sp. HUAS TT1]|uniref:hypothetical protein n=1 Tax=unclassified Saccharothrix TaxID=2593673 RepID=UPI00345C5BA5
MVQPAPAGPPSPPRSSTWCSRCGKRSYRSRDSALRFIARSRHALLATGVFESGTLPDGLRPGRAYQCEDDPAGTWHVTRRELLPLELPRLDGADVDVVGAVVLAVHRQRGRLFPTRERFVDALGVAPVVAEGLRRVLKEARLLVFDHDTAMLRTTLAPLNVPVSVLRARVHTLTYSQSGHTSLTLPPRPTARPDLVPAVLLEAVLAHPPGTRLPGVGPLSDHFLLPKPEIRRIRSALAELGWLRLDSDHYFTARPDRPSG